MLRMIPATVQLAMQVTSAQKKVYHDATCAFMANAADGPTVITLKIPEVRA